MALHWRGYGSEEQVIDQRLERLKRLDSCAISDALDRVGADGVALALVPLSAPRRIVGRAVTVQLGPDDGRTSRRHLGTAAVDTAQVGDIIVVSHNARTDVAGWGGILSLGASRKGVAGVIVDGACRDVDEAHDLGFPLYARCGVSRTARGRVIETDWNVPVEICGVTVGAGDYVIADRSGVVFIPKDIVDEVIEVAEALFAKEQMMAAALCGGEAISTVMGTDYEQMLKRDAE